MAIIPVRDLSQYGVIADRAVLDVPINAFTDARGVVFNNGRVNRAPVLKELKTEDVTPDEVIHVTNIRQPGTPDKVLACEKDGRLFLYNGAVEDEVTPSGFTPADSDTRFTTTVLGDIYYVNREADVPYKLGLTDTDYVELDNWDDTWKCRSLRTYADLLVAINITEGVANYPNRIRWSEFAEAGTEPSTWDPDTTNNAGLNDIVEMSAPLLDGLALRDVFMVYSDRETWQMNLIGGIEVMEFRKVWDDVGVMSQNCIVEVDGQHIVFGLSDIIIHDGVSKKSIVDGRVKNRIFNTLDSKKKEVCFCVHNPMRSEVWFFYASKFSKCQYVDTDYANEVAIYNYSNDTWSFADVPNVGAACLSTLVEDNTTWSGFTFTWDEFTQTWGALEGFDERIIHCFSNGASDIGIADTQFLVFDNIAYGAKANLGLSTRATKNCYCTHSGVDLDVLGLPLTGYKYVVAIYPQLRHQGTSGLVYIQVGSALYPAQSLSWNVKQPFDGTVDHKLDIRVGGRIMGWSFLVSPGQDVQISGFDLDAFQKSLR